MSSYFRDATLVLIVLQGILITTLTYTFSIINFKLYYQQFLPFGRADLTASASLQRIRGEGPQLHTLCLASAASLTRESSRLTSKITKKSKKTKIFQFFYFRND